jgi:tRNA pseudouridine55 synthase
MILMVIIVDGILIVNKPKGMTSRDVVNNICTTLQMSKLGHTGTLDPMATGVLVLCLGKATKIASVLTELDKEYIAEVTLGIETDTLDITGEIIKKEKVNNISKQVLVEVLTNFIGDIKQEVPKYSAIKINGKKLYEYARSNIEVKLPIREVSIYKLELIGDINTLDDVVKFKILCHVSKGTYIRSLARDIAYKLNTVGCLSALKRTKQGKFTIEESYSLEDIKQKTYKLITIYEALNHLPMVRVDSGLEEKIKNGMVIDKIFDGEMALIVNNNNGVLAIYQTYHKDNTKAKPYKMLRSKNDDLT